MSTTLGREQTVDYRNGMALRFVAHFAFQGIDLK